MEQYAVVISKYIDEMPKLIGAVSTLKTQMIEQKENISTLMIEQNQILRTILTQLNEQGRIMQNIFSKSDFKVKFLLEYERRNYYWELLNSFINVKPTLTKDDFRRDSEFSRGLEKHIETILALFLPENVSLSIESEPPELKGQNGYIYDFIVSSKSR